MHVHAGAVITNNRFGHKGGGFAVGMGHIVYAVFENLHFVCLGHQGVRANADFTLAGCGHFVVMHLDNQAHLFHGVTHGATQVMQAVYRWHRKIAALDQWTVAGVAGREGAAGRPGGFFRIDFIGGARHVDMPLDVVKDKELRFRTEYGGIGDAGRDQVINGALAD